MKRSTKYVALDVHQATTIVSGRAESGRAIARTILPTGQQGLVEFFGGMRGTIHVTFEEGTQAQWMDDLLVPLVDRVIVCDRRGEAIHVIANNVKAYIATACSFKPVVAIKRTPLPKWEPLLRWVFGL